jgi:PRTRC genetic system protein B
MKPTLVTLGSGERLDLSAALLVYANQRGMAFVTAHAVHDLDGKPQLGAGIPATSDALSQLLAPVARSLTFRGHVPHNLLALGPGAMAWWCPPAVRTIWFRSEGENESEALGDRHGKVPHPGLVFGIAADGDWYVFAVKGAARPTRETPLFRAPYFNVWADKGKVCVGNVRTPGTSDMSAMAAWESAFFESRFTHPNPGFQIRSKGGGYAFWRSMLDATPKVFPSAFSRRRSCRSTAS